MAIGPAIGHVVKHQSDSCYIYAFYNAFCAMSSVQSDSGIFSPVGSILAALHSHLIVLRMQQGLGNIRNYI